MVQPPTIGSRYYILWKFDLLLLYTDMRKLLLNSSYTETASVSIDFKQVKKSKERPSRRIQIFENPVFIFFFFSTVRSILLGVGTPTPSPNHTYY
ncbi:hypothetical protein L1887_14946 [Cichorium endivia]|nr:hypothetical protein L1887_14946 [Cichorium endivia]